MEADLDPEEIDHFCHVQRFVHESLAWPDHLWVKVDLPSMGGTGIPFENGIAQMNENYPLSNCANSPKKNGYTPVTCVEDG